MRTIKLKYWILTGILIAITVILIALPGYLRNYLQDHSTELMGRKLTITELKLNYLKVALELDDLVLYEKNETDTFVSFDTMQVNLNPWTLLSSELTVSSFRLVGPDIQLIQDIEAFNFDDMLAEDSIPLEEPIEEDTSSFRYTIQNISIIAGKLVYFDVAYTTNLAMNNLNIQVPEISWDSHQSAANIAFEIGEAGKINLNAAINNAEGNFDIGVVSEKLDISLIQNYLKDFIDFQSIKGDIYTDLHIKGETEHLTDFIIAGDVSVKELDVVDGLGNPILKADEFHTTLGCIDMTNSLYQFTIMELKNPEMMLMMDNQHINLMHFVNPYMTSPVDSTDTTTTHYAIDKLIISNGKLAFEDRTLNRLFRYDLDKLDVSMIDFTESATAVPLSIHSTTSTGGNIASDIIFDWVSLETIDMNMDIKNLALLSFSPYAEYFIASPITQGLFNYKMNVKLTPTSLDNMNSLVIKELEMGRKTKDTTAIKVPVKLALYLLKDKNDKIAFDLPVNGNPDSPTFSYKKLIWQVVSNFLLKTAAAPFKALAGLTGKDPDMLNHIDFEYRMDSLQAKQTEILDDLAAISLQKPELIFLFAQFTNPEEEMKTIALERAKTAYINTFMTADSTAALNSKSKDITGFGVQFIEWMKTRVPNSESMDMEELSLRLSTPEQLKSDLNELIQKRDEFVRWYLVEQKKVPSDKIQMLSTDFNNIPEELQKPHYKIEVTIE